MSQAMKITVEFWPGTHISTAAEELCGIASKSDCEAVATFNGVELMATPKSATIDVLRVFDLATRDRGGDQ